MVRLGRILFCQLKDWHNFPKAYVKKVIEEKFPSWEENRGVQGRKVMKKPFFWYGQHRPWERGWLELNKMYENKPPPAIEKIEQWDIFKGDRVQVLVGPDKGKQGLVNYIVKERNWVYVEGLNAEYVTIQDKSMRVPLCLKRENPLRVLDEVALVDPADNKPTTIQWKYNEKGERIRVSDRSNRHIPTPGLSLETRDYKTKASYLEQPKDTLAADHDKITYVPKLKTFQQDIADTYGILDYSDQKSTPRYYY